MQEKGLLECFGTYKTYGNFEHIRGRTFRTVETIHRWRRLLSDDGDFSTDGGDYSWMAEAALGRRRLLHGQWRPSWMVETAFR